MSEIHPFDVDQVLPARGLLSFFFNIREYAWGTYPEDAAKFAKERADKYRDDGDAAEELIWRKITEAIKYLVADEAT